MLRALTLKQPWAWAIFNAGKDVENRSWQNQHSIGTIAIHAGLGRDDLHLLPSRVRRPSNEELVQGAILGVVDVVNVVERHRSKWFHGPLGWVLENPRALQRPIPYGGTLGLWVVPERIERAVRRQLRKR
jgi:hypothetical protein